MVVRDKSEFGDLVNPNKLVLYETENLKFILLLPVNSAVQLDLTGLLKSVDRLIDMIGSVFRTKVI